MAELTDASVHGDAGTPHAAFPPPEVPTGRRARVAGEPAKPGKAAKAPKVGKWDRPPHPRDWRFWVGGTGRVLLAAGILMFGFVAYQLWGTGLETARAQRSLENEFEDLLTAAGTTTVPSTTAATTPATEPPGTAPATSVPTPVAPPATTPPTTEPIAVDQQLPPIVEGDPVARIEMPSIGADHIVVAGVSVGDLRRGPGHFPETPLPGQLGNAAVAGHRTTYGQPFRNVDDLAPGDEIILTTLAGRFVYTVTGSEVVNPDDTHVLATTDPTSATVTLVSCDPPLSARNRIIVYAALDSTRSDAVGLPTPYAGFPADAPATTTPATTVPATTAVTPATASTTIGTTSATSVPPPTTGPATTVSPTLPAVSESSQDAFSGGWFSDDGAFPHVAMWGLAVSVISLGAWLLSRRTRHDSIGFLVGIAPFAVSLFFFFQNVNRLLPPSL